MRGKLIVIEGTNNSGKETQTKLLVEKLNKDGIKCEKRRFPDYSSPTGKIISEDILGKHQKSLFDEGINKIPPKVAALYYAADRLYNIDKINEAILTNKQIAFNYNTYSKDKKLVNLMSSKSHPTVKS